MNTVILGDMSLSGETTSLRPGTNYATIPYSPDSNFACSFSITPITLNNSYNTFMTYLGGEDRWELRLNDNGVVFRTYVGGLQDVNILIGDPTVGEDMDIALSRIVDDFTVSINGVDTVRTSAVRDTATEMRVAATLGTGDYNLSNLMYNNYKYVQQHDYGKEDLPSTPSGMSGVLNDVYWWKKGVDQNFPDPDSYKATLVSPLTEDQNVIYTDAQPFYETANAYWNPYNQDVTYTFNVNKQSIGGATTDGFAFTNYTYSYSY